MGYDISWKIEERVILGTLAGNITAQDIRDSNEQLRQHIAMGQNPVHVVLDLRALKNFPMNMNLFKTDYPLHDTNGWAVIVGGNAIMNYLANVVAKVSGTSIHPVDTLSDAYQFLAEKDPTLNFDD